MPYKVLDDANSDGVVLGQNATAKVGLYGGPAIPQRSMPMQANIQGLGGGMLSTAQFSVTFAAVASYSCVEQYYAITPTNGLFCETTDFILCVNKPTLNSNIGIAGYRISGTNQIALNFADPTGIAITPTQPEIYTAVILHGAPVITQSWTPIAVPSLSTMEQIVTVMGSGAAGTAIINAAGQVVGVNITAGGSGYSYPPAILLGGGVPEGGLNTPVGGSGPTTAANLGIIGGSPFSAVVAPGAADVSGTYAGLNYPAATAAAPYGSGATAIAVVNSGAIVGAVITAPGSGYQVAPSVSFVGGNLFSPGMMAHVNKPSATTGLGIGNVRVAGPYQLGVEFINNTASTITPIGEAYNFLVTNEFSAVKNVMEYVWTANTPIMGVLGVATNTNIMAPATLVGILSTDYPIAVSKPSGTTVALGNLVVSAASLLNAQFIGSQCATLTAGEYWNATIWRRKPQAPSSLLYPYLSFTNPITSAGTYEVQQTVTGVPALSQVQVSKGSHTSGIAIVNARVSAANTIQLSIQNCTSGNISLPTEFYTVEVFNTPAPGAERNALSYVIQAVNPTVNQLVDLGNELRDSLDVINAIKGA